MYIFRTARFFVWGLILGPLAAALTVLIFTYFPGLAKFLTKIFWGSLGQVEIFSQAGELLDQFIHHQSFNTGTFALSFLQLLFNAMADSAILGCCVFAVKSAFVKFNRKWEGRFTKPVWLITFVGVFVGVTVCWIKDYMPNLGQTLITLFVCLGCYIIGIALMLRGVAPKKGGTYFNRRAGFIANMLLGILGDILDAFCGVFIITAMLEGPQLVKAGGSLWLCILWVVAAAVLLTLKYIVMDLLECAV